MQKKINASVTQLYLLIFITAAGFIGLALYGINDYKKLNDDTRTLYADRVVSMRLLASMRFQYSGEIVPAALNVKNHLLTFDEAQQRVKKARLIIDSNWHDYKLTNLTPEESVLAKQTDTLKGRVDKETQVLESILLKKDAAALDMLIKKQSPATQTAFSMKLTQLMDLQGRVGKQIFQNSSDIYTSASKNLPLLIPFSLLIALSFFIVKNIMRLVKDILTSHDIIALSEQKYRSILENASDAIYIADNTGNFIDLSKSMCEMLGYSKEELFGLNFSDIVDPENLKADPVERPTVPNQPIFKERTFITSEGKKVEVEISGQRLDADRLMGVARNVTERKRIAAELREAEIKFRTLVEQSIVGVYLSRNHQLLYVNQRFAEILGYEPQELIDMGDKVIDNIYNKENQEIIRANLQARYNGAIRNIHYEVEGIKKDGTSSWTEVYGNIVNINDQPVTIGTTLDITERKRAEQLILKEKELSNTIINSLPGIFYLRDENGRGLRWNKNLEAVTGYTAEEIEGTVLRDLIAEEDRETMQKSVETTFKDGYSTAEIKLVTKDGRKIPYLLSKKTVNYENTTCLLGIGTDISQRVNAEEELKISERNLAEYNRELNLLNTINDVILRNEGELKLYEDVCNCIVEVGDYKLAWICHEPDKKDVGQIVKPLAVAGAVDYLSGVKIDLSKPEQAEGPTGTALRTRKTFANNDVNNIAFFAPWVERAKKYGIHSSLSLYLDLGNGKTGALNVYSGQANAFDTHQVSILERLAANLSIAVQSIENRSILIESENRFRSAFEDSAIGMGLVSPAGKWLKVNRSIYEMLGYTEQELLSLTFQQITHPEDLEKDLGLLHQTLLGEIDTYRMEKRYFHKDGNVIWINLNVSLVRGADKLPLYFVSQIENITERVESQLKFQNLVENFIVGVYIHQNGRIVYVNPRLLEESGYTGEDLIGRPFEQFIYKDDLDMVKKVTEEREKGQIDTVRYEARFVKKDGQPIWFEIFGSRTVYQGAPALMGTMVNISERKAVYDELIKSEANLRSIFDTTEVNYMLLDTNYDIVAINQQSKDWQMQLAGVAFEKGVNVINALSPDRRERTKALYDRVIFTNQPEDYETSYLKDGAYTHFLANVKPIHDGKKAIGICITGIDITSRKNALEKLKEANEDLQKKTRELEFSNTELEQFAYVASHDLQEPLRMVTSFLSQLEKKYGDILDEKGKKYIYFATDGAKRMRQLILDLLEFSRVGRAEERLEEVNFNNLINEVLPLYRKNIGELKAKVYFEQLPVMQVYKTPVRQVFQNLLSNALKYYREGVAPEITISSKETQTAFEFLVKDNGIGIDPEYFNQIFIIFKRLHNRDQYPGTGVGLAITKKIIENMGGRIWVDSREGEGSVFHFTIPKYIN